MSECQIKTGLFVIKKCKQPTQKNCSSCGKFACNTHAMVKQQSWLCFECYGAQMLQQNQNPADEQYRKWSRGDKYQEGAWYLFQRLEYMAEYGLEPFLEADFAEFEQANQVDFKDDKDNGDLFDS